MNSTSGSTAISKLMDLQEFANQVLFDTEELGEHYSIVEVCEIILGIIKEQR